MLSKRTTLEPVPPNPKSSALTMMPPRILIIQYGCVWKNMDDEPGTMAVVSFLAPLSMIVLAIIWLPRQRNEIIKLPNNLGHGLNRTLAGKNPIASGLEALVSVTSKSAIFKRKGNVLERRLLLSLLMLSGNIEVNPGPIYKYPCGICSKPTKSNQKAIQCDFCDIWHHVKCIHLVYGYALTAGFQTSPLPYFNLLKTGQIPQTAFHL